MDKYKYSIGVAGTHGKTTTTSMIANILLKAKTDPTISVGGNFPPIGSNFRRGESQYFLAESCEYFDSFLKFYPYIGIILNIDRDHTDYFKSMEQLNNSFNRFGKNIKEDGYLIINHGLKDFNEIVKDVNTKIITFGVDEGDYHAKDMEFCDAGMPGFNVYYKGEKLVHINLNISGVHNVENAIASIATCHQLGIDMESIKLGLDEFEGPQRRFEFKGSFNDILVIDDYAHHPTEIAATLSAAKRIKHNKIYGIFQPHTFSRTKALLDRFAGAFVDCDIVVLLDIFPAREIDTGEIHSKDLMEKLVENGKEVYYFDNMEDAQNFLLEETVPNDLLITMGAGDVYLLGERVLAEGLSTQSTEN